MKVLYYLIGGFALVYLFSFFYETKKEKEFFKKDLEEGGITFVNSLEGDEPPSVLMKNESEVQSAQKYGTTVLDQMDNTFQGDLKRSFDDVKGAVPLRRN